MQGEGRGFALWQAFREDTYTFENEVNLVFLAGGA